jgi:hypothetical protein
MRAKIQSNWHRAIVLNSRRYTSYLCLAMMIWQSLQVPSMAGSWGQTTTAVEVLAKKIDCIEKQLDGFGTVVAKSPDVWGQARLTKYRTEYEDVLSEKKGKFEKTFNAAISRTDQTFLATALAISAAVQPGAMPSAAGNNNQLITTERTQSISPAGTSTNTKEILPEAVAPAIVSKIDLDDPSSFVKPDPKSIVRQDTLITSLDKFSSDNVQLEPTVSLDQLSRYLNHLHELRRINDGDDKSDSPGYALHLVRIPVSVLPGDKTREGYGAEITVSAKPHLHDKLLPEVFRSLVINDLIDQLSFPMAKFLDNSEADKILKMDLVDDYCSDVPTGLVNDLEEIIKNLNNLRCVKYVRESKDIIDSAINDICNIMKNYTAYLNDNKNLYDKISELKNTLSARICNIESLNSLADKNLKGTEKTNYELSNLNDVIKYTNNKSANSDDVERLDKLTKEFISYQVQQDNETSGIKLLLESIQSTTKDIEVLVAGFKTSTQIIIPNLGTARTRRSSMPYTATQLFDVYGFAELQTLAKHFSPIKTEPKSKSFVLLADMQSAFGDELNSAYEFLNAEHELWFHCKQELAQAVRQHDISKLCELRHEFLSKTDEMLKCEKCQTDKPDCPCRDGKNRLCCLEDNKYIGVLAWGIIVESALLNERLVEDMRNLSAAKNAYCLNTEWLPYFGPDPQPEAIASFNSYVQCRWPIQVISVDPVTSDQNVIDQFAQTRELQLAAAVGLATGELNVRQFSQLIHRLELKMETIELNRTVIGFSHGDDTFGWRFYPRFQSPDSEGSFRAMSRTLFSGGHTRDALMKQRRLEPGIRECTAIVIMPSFVPYVVFDFRTNWFKLVDPSKKVFDLKQGVGMGADITQLKQLTQQCVKDANCYRQDDVYRLTRTVDQLEKRLPLQTTYVQVPFENTLGGFEFFNTGVSCLGPELKGYIGEPGINISEPTSESSILLVGDHFSVHETKVLVGNYLVPKEKVSLLSRQVMSVTVPGSLLTVSEGSAKNAKPFVDVHVATPYGASNHIDVPVLNLNEPADAKKTAEAQETLDTLRHPIKFAFKEEKVQALIRLNDSRKVESLSLQAPVVIETNSKSPFQMKSEFKAYVYLTVDDKRTKDEPFVTDCVWLVEKNGVLSWGENSLSNVIQASLKKGNGAQFPDGKIGLEIVGYARVHACCPDKCEEECQCLQGGTVIQLEKPLVIELKVCEAQCDCKPASSTTGQTQLENTPFDITENPWKLRDLNVDLESEWKQSTSSNPMPKVGRATIQKISQQNELDLMKVPRD